jgi:hypothetical protein
MDQQATPRAEVPQENKQEPVQLPCLLMPMLPSLTLLALDFWKELLGGGISSSGADMVHGFGKW